MNINLLGDIVLSSFLWMHGFESNVKHRFVLCLGEYVLLSCLGEVVAL